MNDNGGMYVAIGAVLGCIFGVAFMVIGDNIATDSPKNQIKKEIELCEQNLPRYQHCVIKGVVKE